MATYVLIPGAGDDAWYWHQLVPELRERGHAAVAVDLPADDNSARLPKYADAVVGAVADRTDLVLVAQSLGGFTAPLVCERVRVDLLVMLNAMAPSPGESAEEWWANTGHAKARVEQAARDGRDLAADEDLRDAFFHDVPPEVTAEAWARGWIVERTFSLLIRNRRLSKDYERLVQTSETFIEVAMIRLLLRRPARGM